MDRVVTVGRIMTASTMAPDRIPAPVPAASPKMARIAALTTVRPIRPYTTDGMPTRSSTSGWKTLRPNPGLTSTTKMAEPTATGRVSAVDRMVTPNELTISGSAPNLSSDGTQLVPVRNAPRPIPSWKKAESPCWATMTMSVTTTRATAATHAPVRPSPMFSRRRFGSICFAIAQPFSYLRTWRDARPHGRPALKTMGSDYLLVTLPEASFWTFMPLMGMKPSFSTSEPWTSSPSMYSTNALVAASTSAAVYMCS